MILASMDLGQIFEIYAKYRYDIKGGYKEYQKMLKDCEEKPEMNVTEVEEKVDAQIKKPGDNDNDEAMDNWTFSN